MRTLFALPLVLAMTAAPSEARQPRPQEVHPEVRLPTIDGKRTVSLESLRGNKVLLLQFASW